MTFINFLKLNCLDTYRPIKKDKTKEMSLFLRPEEVYIQDPCQLHLLSISQMWHCLALQFSVSKEKSDNILT